MLLDFGVFSLADRLQGLSALTRLDLVAVQNVVVHLFAD
jgi:hypothetical protein